MGPPFFIVGSARSGTTLLRLILNAHPLVAVPPESRFVVELWDGNREVDSDAFLARLAAHRRFQNWDLPIEAVAHELGSEGPVDYADAIRAAFRAYARVHGKPRWGDKTPRYVERLPLIAQLFPEAKIIHLIRDGRNVALSYADVDFGPKTVGGAAEIWARRVAAGRRAGRELGPKRYLDLHYERLVEDTAAAVRDLCEFLDLDFDSGMLDYTSRARDAVLSRAYKFNPHLTQSTVREVRSWENDMSSRNIQIFEAVAGDVLEEAGYPRKFGRAAASTRAMAWLARHGAPVGRLKARR